MDAAEAGASIRRELGLSDLSRIFEWINFEKPLGSASVSQVSLTTYLLFWYHGRPS